MTGMDTNVPSHVLLQLPVELWLRIFYAYCSHFDSDDIANIALINRFFQWMARPILFSKVAFTIRSIPYVHPPIYWQTADYHRRHMMRLKFFSSSHIAPLIKSIRIEAINSFDLRNRDSVTCEQVVNPIFDTLPRFTNLESFYGRRFTLTASYLRQLSFPVLPSLSSLKLVGCPADVTWHDSPPDFRLKSLVITHVDSNVSGYSEPWWMDAISPEVTEKVDLSPFPQLTSQFLAELTSDDSLHPHPLDALQSLRMNSTSLEESNLATALAKLPSLKDLEIRILAMMSDTQYSPFSDEMEAILAERPDVIPHITSIVGPVPIVVPIIRRRSLRQVDIYHIVKYQMALSILSDLKMGCPHLTHLTMHLDKIGFASIVGFLGGFRELEKLDLTATRVHFGLDSSKICEVLRQLDLPKSLRRVDVGGTSDCPEENITNEDPLLHSRFMNEFPHLKAFVLVGRSANLVWNRADTVAEVDIDLDAAAADLLALLG